MTDGQTAKVFPRDNRRKSEDVCVLRRHAKLNRVLGTSPRNHRTHARTHARTYTDTPEQPRDTHAGRVKRRHTRAAPTDGCLRAEQARARWTPTGDGHDPSVSAPVQPRRSPAVPKAIPTGRATGRLSRFLARNHARTLGGARRSERACSRRTRARC